MQAARNISIQQKINGSVNLRAWNSVTTVEQGATKVWFPGFDVNIVLLS